MTPEPTAEWTLHPIAERETARERRWAAGNRRTGCALAVVSLGFCPMSCIGLALDYGPLTGIGLSVAALLAVALGAEKLRRGSALTSLAQERRSVLRETYRHVNGWLVELTIFQGAAPTGWDRGALWFEDGRLFFVGERTSFGLAPAQAERGLREAWSVAGIRGEVGLDLRVRTALPVSLGIDFLPWEGAGPGLPRRKEFRRAYDDWISAAAPAEGQLPPLSPGPDAPSATVLLFGAVANTAFWAVLALGLAAVGAATVWWAVPFASVFLSIFLLLWDAVWVPRRRWRAWRDRRRVTPTLPSPRGEGT